MSEPGGFDDAGEPGLFVIWAKARGDDYEILADLGQRFRLTGVREIAWRPALVRRNYERFYSDLEVRGVYHEINKGAGPFIVATVIDHRPVHDVRQTTRGSRDVNTNFFDAKVDYRARVGHMGLHCSETALETRRDTIMLLGPRAWQCEPLTRAPWAGSIDCIDNDVVGAEGWDSEADLWVTLDAAADYVVLAAGSSGSILDGHEGEEPQILTSEYHTVHTVLNAESRFRRPPRFGGRFIVEVEGSRRSVGIRPIGDGFIDANWARSCLENTVVDDSGVRRPPKLDDLAARCYLALARRRHLTDSDRTMISELAERSDPPCAVGSIESIDRAQAMAVVDGFLSNRGYSWVMPSDPTVAHHIDASGSARLSRIGRAALYVSGRMVGGSLRTLWLSIRDFLVFRAPTLRALVRRLVGHT